MRCFITGVAGFVGSHLAERLLADGHEVCGIDAFIDYYPRAFKEGNLELVRASRHFTFIEGNLLDIDLVKALEGVEWIFHQAAQAGVRASWGQDFARYVDCNVLATQRLLEAALQVRGVQRFVYASSSSVYGEVTALPVVETVTPCPISPYGVTKLAAEQLCHTYYHSFGLPTVSLRYFTVYGPRQRPDMAFHRFCKALLEQRPISIYDDGNQTRDFTYIADVVEANIRAAMAEAAIGRTFNIAGGSRISVRRVIDILQQATGISPVLQFSSKQNGDVRDTFADTSLAQEILGYHPVFSLYEGLRNEFEYVRKLYTGVEEFVYS